MKPMIITVAALTLLIAIIMFVLGLKVPEHQNPRLMAGNISDN